ncbi:MAG: glutamate formimidoyltransferase [bacterium]|nr:glutamate formimidoyltransferase [bacterium]
MKLVECVPNFSEGKDMNVIKQITDAIESVSGTILLDVDPGAATNRTVITFIGTPEAILESAFLAIKKGSELIDMSKHKGEHPRMGACDVCPFVPVSDISVKECVELAKKLGERVANELNIPVYLYEYAATEPKRKSLANIREGEYEGLKEKIKDPLWKPDFGKAEFNPKSGATVIGVRDFLIAYNINLNTKDAKLATKIANVIREKGYPKKDENGKIVKDENGKTVYIPGLLKECRAIGWFVDDYNIAQISINLTNWKVTPPHVAYEKATEEANRIGVKVTGSELVGLIPKAALIEAGKYYLKKQNKSTGIPEKEILYIAIKSLGLDTLYPFEIEKKVIEYAYESKMKKKKLIDMSLKDFCDELSTDSPAPGGGSVAALSGSIAASLVSMVANLTFGKKGYEKYNEDVEDIAVNSQRIKNIMLGLIDLDTEAFNYYMEVFKMPKKSEEEKRVRDEKLKEATKKAIDVPLKTLETIKELLPYLESITEKGNVNSISDAGVSALNLISCAEGAYMNILINLKNMTDEGYKKDVREKSKKLLDEINQRCEKVKVEVYKTIG